MQTSLFSEHISSIYLLENPRWRVSHRIFHARLESFRTLPLQIAQTEYRRVYVASGGPGILDEGSSIYLARENIKRRKDTATVYAGRIWGFAQLR